jgi:hypothetical protein
MKNKCNKMLELLKLLLKFLYYIFKYLLKLYANKIMRNYILYYKF